MHGATMPWAPPPPIEPPPPRAGGALPWIGAGIVVSAIRIAVRSSATKSSRSFTVAEPGPAQIGAVARAAGPCVVRYRARA